MLLVNLGTPDTADAKGVRVYLREFLSDPRVIEDQGLFWKLILNGIILRIRPPRKARDYQKIWNTEKNEFAAEDHHARAGREARAGDRRPRPCRRRLGDALRQSVDPRADRGADRARLRPHSGGAALSAIFGGDLGHGLRRGFRVLPTCARSRRCGWRRLIRRPDYIDALAVSINAHLATLPFKPETIVASFHGMPQKYVDKGDPYHAQCVATTEALRKRLGLDAKLMLTFQSRFGFDEWLQPYTDKTIEELAKYGVSASRW